MASPRLRLEPEAWKTSRGYPTAWPVSSLATFADASFQKNPQESLGYWESAPRKSGKVNHRQLQTEKKDSESSLCKLEATNIQAQLEVPKVTAQAWREEVRRRAEAAISSKKNALLSLTLECDSLRAELCRVNDAIAAVTTDPWVVVLSFVRVAWPVMRYLPMLQRWRNGNKVHDPMLEDALDLTRDVRSDAFLGDRRMRAEDQSWLANEKQAFGGISFSQNGTRTEVFIHCVTMHDAAVQVEKQDEILSMFPPIQAHHVNVFMEPENSTHRDNLEQMNIRDGGNTALRTPFPPFVPLKGPSSQTDLSVAQPSPQKVPAPSIPRSLSTPRDLPVTTPPETQAAAPLLHGSRKRAAVESSTRSAKISRVIDTNAVNSAVLWSLYASRCPNRPRYSSAGAVAPDPFSSSQQRWARIVQHGKLVPSVFARNEERHWRDARGRRREVSRSRDGETKSGLEQRDGVLGSSSVEHARTVRRSTFWEDMKQLNADKKTPDVSRGDVQETEPSGADRRITEVLRPSVAALVGFDEPLDADEDDSIAE